MKSVASAPGKVILFGEHFVVHGTKAILCSIDKRIIVTSQIINKKIIKIDSNIGNLEVDSESINFANKYTELKPFWYIARYALNKFRQDCGIEIVIESEIPSGIGLGSSSAACVATAASVTSLFEKLTKEEILKIAIQAERTIFENTSGADCYVCTFGGLIEYDTKTGYKKIKDKIDFDLVIANSKQIHHTSDLVDKVRRFKENNEVLFASLLKKEITIIEEALFALKENDLPTLGLLMSENQILLEQIGISNEKLNLLVKEARKITYGAKITGAGGGGCIIALADRANLDKILASLSKHAESFHVRIDCKGLLDTF